MKRRGASWLHGPCLEEESQGLHVFVMVRNGPGMGQRNCPREKKSDPCPSCTRRKKNHIMEMCFDGDGYFDTSVYVLIEDFRALASTGTLTPYILLTLYTPRNGRRLEGF